MPAAAACVIAPVSLIAPVEVTVSVPLPTPEAPSTVGTALVSETLFAPLLFSDTAPVKRLAWVSVIAFAPAEKEAAPAPAACVIAPVWVIAPVEVTVSVPLPTPEAPSFVAAALVSETLFAPLLLSDTAPMKWLAWVSVIAFAPAVKDAAPAPAAWVIAPVWVIAPIAVTVSVPLPTLEVPSTVGTALVSETLFAPLLLSDTAPVKWLAWVSVIAFAPALKDAAPAPAAWVIAPVWMIAPVELMVSVPLPTLEVPSTVGTALVSETLFAPLLVSDTAPVRLLFCVKVIAFAPALKVVMPAAAAWV